MPGFFAASLDRNIRAYSDKTALVVDGRGVTYGQLGEMVEAAAAALHRCRMSSGDRIGVHAKGSVEAIACSLAILRSGGVLFSVSHTADPRNAGHQINDAEARAIFTTPDMGGAATLGVHGSEAADEAPSIRVDFGATSSECVFLHRLPRRSPVRSAPSPGVIFFTSGSTARPKGVLVDEAAMSAAVSSVTRYIANTPDDVVLSFTPDLSSDYGFYNVVMPLLYGGTAIVETAFPTDGDSVADLILREKVTGLQVFPTALFQLARIEDQMRWHMPSLRYISSSGQLLPRKLIRLLRERLPKIELFSNYGLTEFKRISYLPPHEIDRRPHSVGHPLPGVRAYIVGPDGERFTEPHVTGELTVAGDLMMCGYWTDEGPPGAPNSRKIREDVLGERRVFFTGDLFEIDRDGFLYFICRKADLFMRNGTQVNPRAIERALLEHDTVMEVAVVAISDTAQGHVPKAFVVPAPGRLPQAESLIEFCRKQLPAGHEPVSVTILSTLPRTFGGKTSVAGLV